MSIKVFLLNLQPSTITWEDWVIFTHQAPNLSTPKTPKNKTYKQTKTTQKIISYFVLPGIMVEWLIPTGRKHQDSLVLQLNGEEICLKLFWVSKILLNPCRFVSCCLYHLPIFCIVHLNIHFIGKSFWSFINNSYCSDIMHLLHQQIEVSLAGSKTD